MRYFKVFVILFLFIGCQNAQYKHEEKILEHIISFYQHNTIKNGIYIINGTVGCDGCKKRMADFFKQNRNVNDLFYIFSSNSSKEVKAIYPYSIRVLPNFIYDNLEIAIKEGLINGKPKILLYKEGHIIQIEEVNYSSIEESLKKANNWIRSQ